MEEREEYPRLLGTQLLAQFQSALDDLQIALERCPKEQWEASLWRVRTTDPWVWPRNDEGVQPRTEEQIQVFSAFWMVAYHCLRFVDFYLWDGVGSWAPPPRFRDGPEEQPIGADGAAPLPSTVYSPDELLEYIRYCRVRARDVLTTLSSTHLERRCAQTHPHSGKTFQQLLDVNLQHVAGHAQQLMERLRSHE